MCVENSAGSRTPVDDMMLYRFQFNRTIVPADIKGEETSVEKAQDAFQDLFFMENILEVLDEFSSCVQVALEEGRNPQSIVADMHMIFHGKF